MRKIYIKEEVCIGCGLCEVYCQLQHASVHDLIKAFKKRGPRPLARGRVEAKGNLSFSVRCRNCDEPQCAYACLTGAITRNPETKMITVDEDKCIGCCTCMLVCPLGAIKQDKEHKKMIKCDFCQGEDTPACVANCPNEALFCVEYEGPESEVKTKVPSPV
jgi:carbon-monoxide dehydrogenase iron sulfur subunit